jgi:multicomponent Na+:H+ antiporter subunit E
MLMSRVRLNGAAMRRTLQHTLILTGSWWILTEGDPTSWTIGAPTVALAVWVSHRSAASAAAPMLRVRAIPGFALFFASRSLLAGLDVARRTVSPKLPIAPRLLAMPTTLPAGLPRVLLVAVLSLMPGSLGVSLEDEQIVLHVLDAREDVMSDVRRTETRIARLFGAELTAHSTA